MKEFFANLKKSTRITLVSCASFIGLTLLILFFFVMFPITPSEKVIASFGRESVAKLNEENEAVVTTTAVTEDILVSRSATTTVTTSRVSRTNFTITVTTGEGFYSGNYIATGAYPYESYANGTSETTASDGSWITDFDDDYGYPLPDDNSGTTGGDNGNGGGFVVIEPVTSDPGTVDPGNNDDPGTIDPGNNDDPGTVDPGNSDDPGTVTPVDDGSGGGGEAAE